MSADEKSREYQVSPAARNSIFAKIFPEQAFSENITEKVKLIERAYDITDADYCSARTCPTTEVDFPKKVSSDGYAGNKLSDSSIVMNLKNGTVVQFCKVLSKNRGEGLCIRAMCSDSSRKNVTFFAEEFLFTGEEGNKGAFGFRFPNDERLMDFSYRTGRDQVYSFYFSVEDTDYEYGINATETAHLGRRYFYDEKPEFAYVRKYMEVLQHNYNDALGLLAIITRNKQELPFNITPSLYWSYPASMEELNTSLRATEKMLLGANVLLSNKVEAQSMPVFSDPPESRMIGLRLEFPKLPTKINVQIYPDRNGTSAVHLNIPRNESSSGPIYASIVMLLNNQGRPTQYFMKLYPRTQSQIERVLHYAVNSRTGSIVCKADDKYQELGLPYKDGLELTLASIFERAHAYVTEL